MDLTKVINNIQRSNIKADKELICKAVQEYNKTLNAAGAVKAMDCWCRAYFAR